MSSRSGKNAEGEHERPFGTTSLVNPSLFTSEVTPKKPPQAGQQVSLLPNLLMAAHVSQW